MRRDLTSCQKRGGLVTSEQPDPKRINNTTHARELAVAHTRMSTCAWELTTRDAAASASFAAASAVSRRFAYVRAARALQ